MSASAAALSHVAVARRPSQVLFVSLHFEECEFYQRLGEYLAPAGVQTQAVSLSRKAAIDSPGGSTVWMRDLLNASSGRVRDDAATIAALERRFKVVSLRQMYLPDQGIKDRPEAEKLALTLNYIAAWDHYFDEHPTDCFITDVGAELIRVVGAAVAESRGVHCVFISCLPFPNELTLSASAYHQVDPLALSTVGSRTLTADQRDEVQRYIDRMIARRPVNFTTPFRVSPARLLTFARHLWIDWSVERSGHEHFNKLQHARKRLTAMVRKHLVRRFYRQPDLSARFVFLPLHANSDYSLTVKAAHCVDQRYLVRMCSDALPVGYTLVIKEHPAGIGDTSARDLKEMLRRDNVVLAPPEMSSHDLIARAAAVVTVNSTVGLEALLYRKPVITLGFAYYAGVGLTIDVSSLADLPQALRRAIDFKVDDERLFQLLHVLMSSTFEGRLFEDRSDDNVRVLARSIGRRLSALGLTSDAHAVAVGAAQ